MMTDEMFELPWEREVLRSLLEVGIEQLDRGEHISAQDVFAELRQRRIKDAPREG